jgi:hypothetical protein
MKTESSTVEPTTEHRVQPDGAAASTLDGLAAALRGRVVRPVDPDYDTTRAVFNGMIDRRPLAIAVCPRNHATRDERSTTTSGGCVATSGDSQHA